MEAIISNDKFKCVPIGFNCHVHMFVGTFNNPEAVRPTMYIFNAVETTMKSICDCIENDFVDFIDRSKFQILKRYSNTNETYLTHTKYNIVFTHDHGPNMNRIPESEWRKFEGKYTTRIEQWRELMQEDKKTLFFIRLGADERKILNEPYFVEENEKFYLEKFAKMMKEKGLKFYILELSSSYTNGYDKENNIIYVNFPAFPMQKIIGGGDIANIIKKNTQFIRDCIYKPNTVNIVSELYQEPPKPAKKVVPQYIQPPRQPFRHMAVPPFRAQPITTTGPQVIAHANPIIVIPSNNTSTNNKPAKD